MWPHQGRVEGKDHLPGPPGHALFHEPQDTIGLRDHKGTPLTHGQPAVRQATSVLLCKAPFHPPTCTNACSYPYPGAGLYTGSYCLPACPGLPKWQHRLMVCQPLFKSEEGLFRGTYYSEHQTFLKISHYFLTRTVGHSFSWETYCECYGITEHMVTPRVSNDLKIYSRSTLVPYEQSCLPLSILATLQVFSESLSISHNHFAFLTSYVMAADASSTSPQHWWALLLYFLTSI